MTELPPGWAEATIGAITAYVSRGRSPKYTDKSRLPVVNQKAIRWFGIQDEHLKFVHEDQFEQWTSERFIQTGDILWNSTGTGTIGRACLVRTEHLNPPKVVDSHVTIVRPVPAAVDPRFLFAWIRGPEVQNGLEELASGSTNQIELNRSTVVATRVPLAPLPEQKRIADKLDALFARVDACRQHLDRVPGILKRFRQSVLAAATSGELTREWREERGIELTGWTRSTVGQLIAGIEAGLNVQCEERPPADSERGLVKISAVTWGTYDDNESKTLPRNAVVPERTRVRTGDFLISRANTLELVGACVIVHRVTRPVFLSDKILRLVMPEEWKPWLLVVLQSPTGRREIEARASGNQLSMRNLSQTNLRDIPIPIPSPHERAEVVRRVESLLGFAEEIDRRCRVGRRTVEKLTPSMLAKAFHGELVPQDPIDEPASELLAKLKAEQSSSAARPPRRRPKTLGKRMPMSNTDKEAIKAAILKLKTERFSFDELSAQFAGDYESLKAALFELLEEPNPVIRQAFDTKAKAMQLVRVTQ